MTGGASGNGRAIASAFAEAGADVVVADIQPEPREGGVPTHTLVDDTYDVESTYVECDVSTPEDVRRAVDAADAFGGVDIMVNNAGIFRKQRFLDVSEADFEEMVSVNVKGVFFGSQYAAASMLETGGGSIINLSSIAGLEGSAQFTTYCMTKGAVRLLTYALAAELGPEEIRVNTIHPGTIETAMTTRDVPIVDAERSDRGPSDIPLGRYGQPYDVADAAIYLASDLSSYVSGESLVVDGGQTNTW